MGNNPPTGITLGMVGADQLVSSFRSAKQVIEYIYIGTCAALADQDIMCKDSQRREGHLQS